MMFEEINNEELGHVYFLLKNNIVDESKHLGLSHVMEHACLMPYLNGEPLCDFRGRGYTCLDHIVLYYTSPVEEYLQTINNQMITKSIICNKNVIEAKHQVYEECLNLEKITYIRKEIVDFVSNGRIKYNAMGNIHSIRGISRNDVHIHLSTIIDSQLAYGFFFKSKDDVLTITNNILKEQKKVFQEKDLCYPKIQGEDEILELNGNSNTSKIEIFFKIPPFLDKGDYIAKTWFEYTLLNVSRKLLKVPISVFDKYYTYTERYIELSLFEKPSISYRSIIDMIRDCMMKRIRNDSIDANEFNRFLYACLKIPRTTQDYINEFQNYILYGIPRFSQEDVRLAIKIRDKLCIFETILLNPIKMVIMNSILG